MFLKLLVLVGILTIAHCEFEKSFMKQSTSTMELSDREGQHFLPGLN